jgi:hypothetical protein
METVYQDTGKEGENQPFQEAGAEKNGGRNRSVICHVPKASVTMPLLISI